MSYPYFFVSGNAVRGDFIFITGEDYSHLIKVLRAKPGDAVGVSDSVTTRYETIIQSIDNDSATLRVLSSRPIKRRKPEIHLYLCFLKKDAMELAIQKNTEIGIDVIIPVHSSRVVVEISGKKKESRLAKASKSKFRPKTSFTYAIAFAKVNASSCAAVAPASRM